MTALALSRRSPSPSYGIGYALWLRGRWPFAIACLLVLLLAFAAQVPVLRQPIPLSGGIHLSVPPILFAVPVVLLPIVSLLNVLTYGPIDVSSKASPFPRHARLLPLSTRELVGWPMLFGAATLTCLWLVLLLLVLRPLGLTTSIVWPTTIVIACTVWAQAAAWIPLPFRFLRAPFFLAAVGIPFCLATTDPRNGDYFWSFEAGMAAWAVAAYVIATLGVKRARMGGDVGAASRRPSAARRASVRAAFPSAFAACRWYELRRTIIFFAKVFGVAPLPLIGSCLLALRFPNSVFACRMGGIPLASTFAAIYVVLVPLLASAALGSHVGRFDHWHKPGMASFFALRPISTAGMVFGKLLSAASAAAILWASGAVVAVFAFWAHAAHAPPRVQIRLDRFYADGGLVDVALVAIAYALLLWRNLAVDLWTAMLGRVWPSRVVAACAGLAFAMVAMLPVTMAWLRVHLDVEHEILSLLPWLAFAVVLAKGAASVVIARNLIEHHLVTPRLLAMCVTGWCAATLLVLTAATRFVNASWPVICVVVAIVPFARIGLAALALDKNRHG